MSSFDLYFHLGVEHITDFAGYDHMLFLLALVAGFRWQEWRPVAWLVTAFTLGHSLSLALATLGWVSVSSAWVEFLIPVTIVATALTQLLRADHVPTRRELVLAYVLAAVFGLIHGLGFSGYLQQLLGRQASLVLPLLAFNLGLELGQLAVVGVLLTLSWLVLDFTRLRRRVWVMGLSAVAGLWALVIAVERWPL